MRRGMAVTMARAMASLLSSISSVSLSPTPENLVPTIQWGWRLDNHTVIFSPTWAVQYRVCTQYSHDVQLSSGISQDPFNYPGGDNDANTGMSDSGESRPPEQRPSRRYFSYIFNYMNVFNKIHSILNHNNWMRRCFLNFFLGILESWIQRFIHLLKLKSKKNFLDHQRASSCLSLPRNYI